MANAHVIRVKQAKCINSNNKPLEREGHTPQRKRGIDTPHRCIHIYFYLCHYSPRCCTSFEFSETEIMKGADVKFLYTTHNNNSNNAEAGSAAAALLLLLLLTCCCCCCFWCRILHCSSSAGHLFHSRFGCQAAASAALSFWPPLLVLFDCQKLQLLTAVAVVLVVVVGFSRDFKRRGVGRGQHGYWPSLEEPATQKVSLAKSNLELAHFIENNSSMCLDICLWNMNFILISMMMKWINLTKHSNLLYCKLIFIIFPLNPNCNSFTFT